MQIKWKVEEIYILPKLVKPQQEAFFYKSILLLPSISKLFEKLLQSIIETKHLIASRQLQLSLNQSPTEQLHGVTNPITDALE